MPDVFLPRSGFVFQAGRPTPALWSAALELSRHRGCRSRPMHCQGCWEDSTPKAFTVVGMEAEVEEVASRSSRSRRATARLAAPL